MTNTLRADGYCVFEAYDTHAGHELALMVPVGLLILDASQDGARAELVHRLVEERREVPLLHIVPEGASEWLLQQPPTLVRPFTGERLLAAVRELLASRASPPTHARISQDFGDSGCRAPGAEALA